MTVDEAVKFLEDAAEYFESRETEGEDINYWSNVQNAENCRKIARLIGKMRSQENKK